MNELDLWDLQQQFEKGGILLCFNGPLSQSIIEELGSALRQYVGESAAGEGKVYDVFSVYIEQSQNIQNYAARKRAECAERTVIPYNSAILVIGRYDDQHYLVASGNMVDLSDVDPLTKRIDELNLLNHQQLKELYSMQRKRPRAAGSATAGLGLIDMARKSSRPMQYRIRKTGSETAYFCLTAII